MTSVDYSLQDLSSLKQGKPTTSADAESRNKEIEETPKKARWMTRSMAENFTREDVLFTTLKEALVYTAFVASLTISILYGRSIYFFYLTRIVENELVLKEFNTKNGDGITFKEIKSPTDLWHFIDLVLIDGLYCEHYYDPIEPVAEADNDDKKILFDNQLLGAARIRQVKVNNDSCMIHDFFRRLFFSCYDLYTEPDEDRTSYGVGNGSAWVHNTEEQTGSIPYTGKISTYGGGGFYVDFPQDKEVAIFLMQELKSNMWITRGTRAVFIDFLLYNANLNLFVICKMVIEFPPTGGLIPSHSFQVEHLLKYVEFKDYITFGCKMVIYIISTFFILEEVREVVYFKWKYFLQFWTYMDLIILGLSVMNFVFSIFILPSVDDGLLDILENSTKYGNLEYLAYKKRQYNEFSAMLLFFSYIKIFKYINFNQTMGQLNSTLKNCALDILGFALMFAVIFVAFAELGYLLFGSSDEEFSSFGESCFSLLRTILGDFNYGPIEEANRVLAPIYFISYIFLVFFVLVNMFIAIISDTYAEVKTGNTIAPSEMQMMDFLKIGLYKILHKCGCKFWFLKENAGCTATVEKISDALTKCGFGDGEIKMFLSSYGIDYDDKDANPDLEKLFAELKKFTGSESNKENEEINVSNFQEQKERAEKIEGLIIQLGGRIEVLIKILESLSNVRKEPK